MDGGAGRLGGNLPRGASRLNAAVLLLLAAVIGVLLAGQLHLEDGKLQPAPVKVSANSRAVVDCAA